MTSRRKAKNLEPKKKYVLIVGAGDLVMPAYRIAREDLGLGIVALDRNPDAPGMKYADVGLEVSTKDLAGAVAAARQASGTYPLAGVFTCGADVEMTVAAIAEALDLPGIPVEVALRCNDKVHMHRHLDQAGFAAKARYHVTASREQAQQAAESIGYPCIVKPLDNCASRGVQRVEGPEFMDDAYRLAVAHNGTREGKILVEECLEGTKHTVEMIAYQDRWHLLSIIDTHYISPRWPCETGLNTTQLSLEMQQRLFSFAQDVARRVGITFGAHKVDVNVSADGTLQVIELTARLSGGFHCQYASPLAFGSNDIRAALKLAVGRSLDLEDIRHRYEKGAAVRAVFPPPGVVTSISGVAAAESSAGVVHVFVWCREGDELGPYLNSADRPAFVIAGGETTAAAIENAERGAQLVSIQTTTRGES